MILVLVERFWSKVDRRGDEECWPWLGSCTEKGYGQMADGDLAVPRPRKVLASHIALAIAGRPRPSLIHIAMHSCDNPPCVNPAHLRWGSQADNIADMFAKGRGHLPTPANPAFGERHHGHKLTAETVRYIRASSKTTIELSDELGVTNQCVSNVRTGRTWRHVE